MNDVFAFVELTRRADSVDDANELHVYAGVEECLDAGCGARTILGALDLGTVEVHENVTLRLAWDEPGNQIVVGKNQDAPLFMPYTVSDTAIASNPNKALDMLNFVDNCDDGVRRVAFMDASWDNLFVNAGAVP